MAKRQSFETELEPDPAISPQITLDDLEVAAQNNHLTIAGALHEGRDTIVLLAPAGSAFWNQFTQSREYHDGKPDPMDRWSATVITGLAKRFDGKAILPSDGPPYAPFFNWALKSGHSWKSPVALLVHDKLGLWISFRGALRLPTHLPLPIAGQSPCQTCAAPCQSTCPVSAFTNNTYNVPRCINHLNTNDSANCMSQGCAARRSCPISHSYGRMPDQSAFHMKAFNPQ